MDEKRINTLLETMHEKYELPSLVNAAIDQDAICVNCASGYFRFILNGKPPQSTSGETVVPLYHWRAKRKFIEMKNVLVSGSVQQPVGMRVRAIVPKGGFWTLDRLLFMEIDIIQWLFDDRISSLFSTSITNDYLNAIFCTRSGIRVSAEIGEAPSGTIPTFLHEIIGRTGIISDLPVDTQTEHSSIYLSKDDKTQVYTDVDFELYGIAPVEIDCIRFIMSVLSDHACIGSLKEEWCSVRQVLQAVLESGKIKKRVEVCSSMEGK